MIAVILGLNIQNLHQNQLYALTAENSIEY